MPEVAVITYQKLGRFKKSCFFRVFHGMYCYTPTLLKVIWCSGNTGHGL
jgi:hypothetical protein